MKAMGISATLNAALVQLFYARRGYLLNRSLWPLSLISVILALTSLGMGLGLTIELVTIPTLSHTVSTGRLDLGLLCEFTSDNGGSNPFIFAH
ncbi:hypothetical protein DL93DRAFT_1520258 [Clavulina sp. PMI_390]|nr:hypothetical protein DL93DRAFT_1520258 [Clavulina sp. PMI_390]